MGMNGVVIAGADGDVILCASRLKHEDVTCLQLPCAGAQSGIRSELLKCSDGRVSQAVARQFGNSTANVDEAVTQKANAIEPMFWTLAPARKWCTDQTTSMIRQRQCSAAHEALLG